MLGLTATQHNDLPDKANEKQTIKLEIKIVVALAE